MTTRLPPVPPEWLAADTARRAQNDQGRSTMAQYLANRDQERMNQSMRNMVDSMNLTHGAQYRSAQVNHRSDRQAVAWEHARVDAQRQANATGGRVTYRAAFDFNLSPIPSGDDVATTFETRYVDPEQMAPPMRNHWDVNPFGPSPTGRLHHNTPNPYSMAMQCAHLSEQQRLAQRTADATGNPVDYFDGDTRTTRRVYPQTSPQLPSEADDRLLEELTGTLTYSQPELEMDQNQINARYFNRYAPIHRGMFVKKQRVLKVGHLVEVHNTSSGWGHTSTRNHYIGVVTGVNLDRSAYVLPLTGAVMQHWRSVADQPYAVAYLGTNCQPCPTPGMHPSVYVGVFFKALNPMSVSRRHMQIIDPEELHHSWEAVANDWRLYRRQSFAGRENVITRLNRLVREAYNTNWRNIRNTPGASSFLRLKKDNKANGKLISNTLRRVRSGAVVQATLTMDYAQERHFASNGRTSGYFAKVLEILNDEGHDWDVASCSHYAEAHTTRQAFNSRGYSGMACQHCLATVYNQSLLNNEGEEVHVSQGYLDNQNVYTWDDGTHRTQGMASIIQSYHSSRGKFRKLRLLDGSEYNGVCVGMELEMESTNDSSNAVSSRAREVDNVLTATMKKLGMPSMKYGFFERDGSVSNGFELVTNYGPTQTHRAVIMDAFGTGQGTRLPFAGKLRAHDATASCGIHVHLTKPKSLLHASRMYQFYNASNMRSLIECVARRYGGNFAKVHGVTPQSTVTKAGEIAKYRKRNRVPLSTTLNQLHGGDRYSAVNFNNDATVEVRVFRGSMLPTTILACMELAYMSWFFCRDTAAELITPAQFMQYIQRAENSKESGYLRAYLIAKGVLAPPAVKRGTKNDIAVESTAGQE